MPSKNMYAGKVHKNDRHVFIMACVHNALDIILVANGCHN